MSVRKAGAGHFAKTPPNAGAAAVELALVLPFYVVLLLGIADFGLAYHNELQLSAALAAGAHYAFRQGQTESGSTLTDDVTTFVSAISPVRLTSVMASYNNGLTVTNCYCVSGTAPVYAATTCGATCADGSTSGRFIAITASFTYTAMAVANRVFFASPLSQSVTVRLQ